MAGYTTRLRSPGADGGGSTAAGSQGDPTTTTNTQGDASGTQPPPNAQAGNPPGAASGTQSNSDGSQWTLEEALAEIERLRKESAARRVAAKAPTTQPAQETPEAKLRREIEEVRKEAETAQAALVRERLTNKLIAAASKAYVQYPDLFVLQYVEQVTFNDAGEPNNISDLIAHARRNYPSLFRVPSADAGAQGGGVTQPKTDMNALMRAQAGRGGTGD